MKIYISADQYASMDMSDTRRVSFGTSSRNEVSILHLRCRRRQQKSNFISMKLIYKVYSSSIKRTVLIQTDESVTRFAWFGTHVQTVITKTSHCATHSSAANYVVDKLLKCRRSACSL